MKTFKIILLFVLFTIQSESKLLYPYKEHEFGNKSFGANTGEPLILTPFLEDNKIQEAREAALIQYEKFQDVVSYAGYFTVDKNFDSNLWFWFFPSANDVENDPVLVWLNGGPGASSLNGLFDENGPFLVTDGPNGDFSITLREYSWHRNHSVIYFDNPVGTGFSFTNGGYAQNETKVGEDLYSALLQFFTLFPELQKNDFFLSGESYAGKYIPATGYTIYKNNPEAELKINLKGLLIGDGWVDPVNQMNYGIFAYETGLVGADAKQDIDDNRDKAIDAINAGDYLAGSGYWDAIINTIEHESRVNIYNYVKSYDQPEDWYDFIISDEGRTLLHVGTTPFAGGQASENLDEDITKSIAPWLEELLDNYRVLIFTGQLDIIVGYPMTLEYLHKLNFSGASDYKVAKRELWEVNRETAGYVRTGGNLTELLVRNSGHMVPMDQPEWGYDMVFRFARNKTFA